MQGSRTPATILSGQMMKMFLFSESRSKLCTTGEQLVLLPFNGDIRQYPKASYHFVHPG
jgi:hypothetical protein